MAFPRPRKTHTESELFEYALGALGRRMRSVAELKRLLRPRVEAETEIGQTLVELVIRRLKDRGYLNDANYAAAYSSFRRDNEKFGRRRVISDLKSKGVHGDLIEKAVDLAYDEVNEEKQARDYLRRKRLRKPRDQKPVSYTHLIMAWQRQVDLAHTGQDIVLMAKSCDVLSPMIYPSHFFGMEGIAHPGDCLLYTSRCV